MFRGITRMERELNNMPMSDTAKARILIGAYQTYAARYSNDSLAPDMLYRAANLCLNTDRTLQALELFKSIELDYPKSNKAPYCLFMQAFVYENYIRDFYRAKQLYIDFIKKYPHHELYDDALNALEFLGKSIEDMLKEIKENREMDSIYETLQ
jgi:TolA-binding protein